MPRFTVILVDGVLAIKWEDETDAEAADRARAGAAKAARAGRGAPHAATREAGAVPGPPWLGPARELAPIAGHRCTF
jgi:hypothetical protein